MATDESIYSHSITGMIAAQQGVISSGFAAQMRNAGLASGASIGAAQQSMMASATGATTQARYPKQREPEALRFSVDKVANGYVMRLAEGYGDMVSPGNTFIASDIKELGDLFISTVVNNQLGK
jgi:hypothetical protein